LRRVYCVAHQHCHHGRGIVHVSELLQLW
jgi:hypothetical protein